MKDKFTLDVGLALDLKNAFRRNDWNEKDVKELTKGNFLRNVREVMLGRAEIKPIDHIIDCDADPYCPDGWSVKDGDHKKGGQFQWDSAKVSLYLSKKQEGSKKIKGNDLRKELEGQPVLNANVLDYLLAHPELILDEWKGKFIFFWGTVYSNGDGDLYVRCLYWYGDGWAWRCSWLENDWNSDFPAMVRAS